MLRLTYTVRAHVVRYISSKQDLKEWLLQAHLKRQTTAEKLIDTRSEAVRHVRYHGEGTRCGARVTDGGAGTVVTDSCAEFAIAMMASLTFCM